jgi:hypothetical protein
MSDIIERAEAALQQLRLVPSQPPSTQLIIHELITELKAARTQRDLLISSIQG